VSALIHAATMVTAGVFLVCRMSPLMEFAPEAKAFIVVVGASTAFFAATVGLVQTDIKRVIAYSTCSQLGYMFVAAGVGMYSAAMFHLLTHAFFKALLFLGAGSVIHAMHHEQDMTNYGGLRKKIPYTYWAMMIGTLAITGVGIPLTHIGFAGFLSKDAIIESAFADGTTFGFGLLVLAAGMTSFYSWRLIFLTFYGTPRGDKHTHDHAHESPLTMLIPLGVLSIGAVFSGMVFYNSFFGHADQVGKFYGIPYAEASAAGGTSHGDETATTEAHAATSTAEEAGHGSEAADAPTGHGEATVGHEQAEAADHGAVQYVFTGKPGQGALYFGPENEVLDDAHNAPKWVKASPFFAMLLGLGLAFWFYILNPSLPVRLAEHHRPLYLFLKNKWYFDELFDAVFVKPAKSIGRFLWKRGDGGTIDGFLNGVAMGVVPFFTRLAGRAQSGFIFTYAFWMVLGIALLVTWMTLGGGAH
jgi:NADH-quinone oxidoreductase subunit L